MLYNINKYEIDKHIPKYGIVTIFTVIGPFRTVQNDIAGSLRSYFSLYKSSCVHSCAPLAVPRVWHCVYYIIRPIIMTCAS